MKFRPVYGIAGVLLCLGGGSYFFRVSNSIPQNKALAVTPVQTEGKRVPQVRSVHPVFFSGSESLAAEGHVIALQTHVLAAPSEGFIRQTYVHAAQSITKGQKILRLENPDQADELTHLRQEIRVSEEIQNNLKSEIKRNFEMYELGLVAKDSLSQLENQLKLQRLNQLHLESQASLFSRHQKAQWLTSPAQGYLTQILPEGRHVALGETLAVWVEPQDLALEAYLPFAQAQGLKTGEKVSFEGGSGVLTEIASEAQAGLVKILIQSPTKLPLDYRLPLQIQGPQQQGWLLPKTAIQLQEGEIQAYKLSGNRVKLFPLKLLEDRGTKVLVAAALHPQDVFVADKLEMLEDGLEVSSHE